MLRFSGNEQDANGKTAREFGRAGFRPNGRGDGLSAAATGRQYKVDQFQEKTVHENLQNHETSPLRVSKRNSRIGDFLFLFFSIWLYELKSAKVTCAATCVDL